MLSKKQVEKECKKLENSIKQKKQFISKSPDGRFKCRRNGKYFNWYVVGEDKSRERYLGKDQEELARKLLLKKIYTNELRIHEKELKLLKTYLQYFDSHNQLEVTINQSKEYARLLEPIFNREWDTKTQEWLEKTSATERPNPEGATRRCGNGMKVRSKSEQTIVGLLDRKGIPFKYEEPLTINYDGRFKTIFPDFTIYDSHTGKEIIWEHFGMMDDPRYRENCIRKISAYIKNGYTPFEDLIMTFEINNSGVDEIFVESLIDYILK